MHGRGRPQCMHQRVWITVERAGRMGHSHPCHSPTAPLPTRLLDPQGHNLKDGPGMLQGSATLYSVQASGRSRSNVSFLPQIFAHSTLALPVETIHAETWQVLCCPSHDTNAGLTNVDPPPQSYHIHLISILITCHKHIPSPNTPTQFDSCHVLTGLSLPVAV